MNWICNSCGYENEYNDESQPTECLCCGEPATEDQLNLARCALEKYHKELEHQKRLEKLRQKALKRQKKIERSVNSFIKSVKNLAVACIVFMILSFALAGFSIYKGSISLNNIADSIKYISVMDNMMYPVNVISDSLNHKNKEYIDNFSQNISPTAKGKRLIVTENMKDLAEKNKKSLTVSFSGFKRISADFQDRYEYAKDNIMVSQSNISESFNNLTVNMNMFWSQTGQNIKLLVDSISKKVGRSK